MKVNKWTKDFGWVVNKEKNEDLMSLKVADVQDLLKKGGAILFHGYTVDQAKFVDFSAQFASNFVKHAYPELRKPLSKDGTVSDVLIGNDEI